MSEDMIIRHCSPTLAGMKTGNIFTCSFESENEMKESIRRMNRILVKKGLRMIPLRRKGEKVLIYVYRPSRLSHDLEDGTASRLLKERGYDCETPERCISHLMHRLIECSEFPHEIGLFLGYPPEDVNGFIENRADGFKYVGCWKVYGDVQAAQRLFKKYKKCTDIFCTQLAQGRSIERLVVAD